MTNLTELGNHIASSMGDGVRKTEIAFGELTLEAKAADILAILRFLRDESFDEAARIDALLRTERVARDTGRPGPAISDDSDEQDS